MIKFGKSLHRAKASAGRAGREDRGAPVGAARRAVAPNGRQEGDGRRRRLHRSGPRLGREEQSREAVLGDDGDVPQRASKHGRAERLLRRRVLLQERQHLCPEAPAGFHHKGDVLVDVLQVQFFCLQIAENFAKEFVLNFCQIFAKFCQILQNLLARR